MIDFYEYIDDYMEGVLDAEMRQAFEEAMKQDTSLRTAVDNYPEAKKLAEGLLELDLMETLENARTSESTAKVVTMDTSQPKPRSSRTRPWMVAASIAALLTIAYIGFQDASGSSDFDQIWRTEYVKPLDPNATKTTEQPASPFNAGKYFFALNDFEEAEKWFTEALNIGSNPSEISEIQYWLGHSYMNQKKWDQAKTALQKSNHPEAARNLALIDKLR